MVSLPNNELTPDGGLQVYITSTNAGQSTIIPEEYNSVNYSIQVQSGKTLIRYRIYNNYHFREGYYSESNSVSTENDATEINVMANIEGIDLNIFPIID